MAELSDEMRYSLGAIARDKANCVDPRVFAELVKAGLALYGTSEEDAKLTDAGREELDG